MAQNYKNFCLSHIILQEPCIISGEPRRVLILFVRYGCPKNSTEIFLQHFLEVVLVLLVLFRKAAVSWKFGHCSARASLKIWWIITHEHWLFDEKEKISFILYVKCYWILMLYLVSRFILPFLFVLILIWKQH